MTKGIMFLFTLLIITKALNILNQGHFWRDYKKSMYRNQSAEVCIDDDRLTYTFGLLKTFQLVLKNKTRGIKTIPQY